MSRAIHVRLCTPTPIVWNMRHVHRQRLLNAAVAVESWDHSTDRAWRYKVYMGKYVKPCGSPACVLGHYAARQDLQDLFQLDQAPNRIGGVAYYRNTILTRESLGHEVSYSDRIIRDHFGTSPDECYELFGGNGCGARIDNNTGNLIAQPPKEVADYIRRFVDHKYPEFRK